MALTDFFWLFIILVALQPAVQKRVLEVRRMLAIDRLQKARGSRVILLVHRQETMSLLGFPLIRYIDVHDSEEVLRAIEMTGDDVPLDIVLHTPGGLVLAALQIARAVEAHRGKVTVFVPHHALSGGTLVALSGDEIAMSRQAVLGPVDPQIGQWAAASVLRAVAQKPTSEIDDETLILADQAGKALEQVTAATCHLLARHMSAAKAEEVARTLATGTWTHDYPISAEEAQALGLPVTIGVPQAVRELMRLYPQPVRRTGGVEYLPVPRERRPGG